VIILGLGVWMLAFLIWVVCAIAGASIASSKGNSGCVGFLLGFLLGPIGLVIAAVWPSSPATIAAANYVLPGPMGACPFCASLIPVSARVCRFCQRDLYSAEARALPELASCQHDPVPHSSTYDICRKCGVKLLRGAES